jgi:hypothetical protein
VEPGLGAAPTSFGLDQQVAQWNKLMTDLIFIGVMVAFFVASGLYVGFCEKL